MRINPQPYSLVLLGTIQPVVICGNSLIPTSTSFSFPMGGKLAVDASGPVARLEGNKEQAHQKLNLFVQVEGSICT